MQRCERTALVVTTVHNPKDNRIWFKQIGSLCDAGWTVHYVCRRAGCPESKDGVQVYPVSMPRHRLLRVVAGSAVLLWRGLWSNARVLHVHDPELFPVARMLGWKFRRVMIDLHDLPHAQLRYKPYLGERVKKPASWLLERVLKLLLFRATVVVAESSYEPWVRQVARATIVVRNYPRVSSMPAPTMARRDVEELRIGYVGVISRARGLDRLASALPAVATRIGKDAVLHLVGGFESARLEQEMLGLHGVEYHGYLPNEEALAVISRMHVGIALTARTPNYDYSLATKIPEYIALGLPVVATDNPINRELFNRVPTVRLIDPASSDALTEALVSIVERPVSVEDRLRARERVLAEMNWSEEFSRLLAVYEATVEGAA